MKTKVSKFSDFPSSSENEDSQEKVIQVVKNTLLEFNKQGKYLLVIKDSMIAQLSNGEFKVFNFDKIYERDLKISVGDPYRTHIRIAPEVLKKKKTGEKSDSWALGIFMYSLYWGCLDPEFTTRKIARMNLEKFLTEKLSEVKFQMRKRIEFLLVINPKNRLKIGAKLSHIQSLRQSPDQIRACIKDHIEKGKRRQSMQVNNGPSFDPILFFNQPSKSRRGSLNPEALVQKHKVIDLIKAMDSKKNSRRNSRKSNASQAISNVSKPSLGFTSFLESSSKKKEKNQKSKKKKGFFGYVMGMFGCVQQSKNE